MNRDFLRNGAKGISLTLLLVAVALIVRFADTSVASAQTEKGKPAPVLSVDSNIAREHELRPHRWNIPSAGIREGFNQLRLTLTVSPGGDVTDAKATGSPENEKMWPQIQGEIYQWKFKPFEKDGKPVTAKVEEYVNLVPPERLPKVHVPPPALRADSRIAISLSRSGCLGSCPAYEVSVTTKEIVFTGSYFVVASGRHVASVETAGVRKLAEKFIEADFYSMEDSYQASVTDCSAFNISIDIDGHRKSIIDYVGAWVGMPSVITDLEEDVDDLAQTKRWIQGTAGLAGALEAEKFNFQTYEAQTTLKAAAANGNVDTVRQLLEAGTPLNPLPSPKRKDTFPTSIAEHAGWLTAAGKHPDVLRVLLKAGASETDQVDKDAALAMAAQAGSLDAVRLLMEDGANPNNNPKVLQTLGIFESGGTSTSVLMQAAGSGNPEVLREILLAHPKLEQRDGQGRTAMFYAVEYRDNDQDGARVECVRMLAKAGARVSARDRDGNTPLHETFLTDVEEELLRLGADINARNKDGETPIFTTVDNDAIPLFLKHGADLTLRNNKGETVFEAVSRREPQRIEALNQAVAQQRQKAVR